MLQSGALQNPKFSMEKISRHFAEIFTKKKTELLFIAGEKNQN